ncbi:parathyroid hormone 2 receptor [Trichuris trichiura]|uniref:Parathyroid hormone 2 receptor n=1 Tax=Trichuris trichiura TaxID=36087 RepID=A0A077Z9B6_TRITR|nr:parathyroid hormone 2 receptor [Trichuris trichiura]
MAIRGVWIFSFHPLFVTKVDRAFDVQCVFRQRDITSQFEMTRSYSVGHQENVRSAVRGNENSSRQCSGSNITSFVKVESVLAIHVKECLAESKRGISINVIRDGCKVQSVMSTDVKHSSDGRMVFATATTFKFPDEEDIWFRCRLIVCSKVQHSGRLFISGSCPEYEKCGARNRTKRSVASVDSSMADDLIENDYDMHIRVIDAYNQRPSGFLETVSDRVSLFNSDTTNYGQVEDKFEVCIHRWVFVWSILNACAFTGMISAPVVKRVIIGYRSG